jgi:hypothetical protein
VAGDDVDHAIDRIGAPHHGAGAADDLDALDVLERHRVEFPDHAGKQRGINAAAIDQHQQLVGETAVEAAPETA